MQHDWWIDQLEANRARGDAPAAAACQGRGGGQLFDRGPPVGGDVGHRCRLQRKDGMQRHVHRNGRVVGQFPALVGRWFTRTSATQATAFSSPGLLRARSCMLVLPTANRQLTLKPNRRLDSEAASGKASGSTPTAPRKIFPVPWHGNICPFPVFGTEQSVPSRGRPSPQRAPRTDCGHQV